MKTKRQERINKLLQRELSEIFQREMGHVTQHSMVTVTKTKVTPDLSLVKVYLSLFTTIDDEILMKNIIAHTAEIRGKLGVRIRYQLRSVPELRFYRDDSLDYLDNIENLLKND